MSDEILIERPSAHVWVVKLHRPAARNAVNAAMARALEAAVEESNADPAVRAVVLTASQGDVFSAGADLKEMAAGRGAELVTDRGGFAGFVRAARSKPWIAAVTGKAFGGGLELCLACDMIVAGSTASFGLPEVLRGVYAGAGGVFRLPQAIPRAVAMEMIATGVPIDAARAYALGLVNRVVAAEHVMPTALELAAAVAKGAPRSVAESLSLARLANQENEAHLWQMSEEVGARLQQTEDFWEGPRAFAEKRAPEWRGR